MRIYDRDDWGGDRERYGGRGGSFYSPRLADDGEGQWGSVAMVVVYYCTRCLFYMNFCT